MSEYQYYEFAAVDRPLTRAQMAKLRSYSTRARITPTRFVNEYHWGNFKGDPGKWMEEFFDGHLYVANWGTRNLYLRLPVTLLNLAMLEPFLSDENFEAWEAHGHLILSFSHDSENGDDDDDYDRGDGCEDDYDDDDDDGIGEFGASGSLGTLLQLRAELARGDLRALYLGWLSGVTQGFVDDDAHEPPVPPGLRADELTGPQRELARFLKIDADLIAAAAEKSAPLKKDADSLRRETEALREWLISLPADMKDSWLLRIAGVTGDENGVTVVSNEIQRAFLEERRTRTDATNADGPTPTVRRTVGELLRLAKILAEARRRRKAEKAAQEKVRREREAAAAREKHLDRQATREHELWPQVHAHIATRLPKGIRPGGRVAAGLARPRPAARRKRRCCV
ncbi:MAG: hypothetical protein LBK99_11860 [Opitutaceae bacterium]|jgi:hypothetical protein|nr:hypothetical protein [Opitutaceae bacterium]